MLNSNHSTTATKLNSSPFIDLEEVETYAFQMSSVQKRFWYLDRLQPGTSAFNLPIAMRITGDLDEVVLERSLQCIVDRHEVLRSTFGRFDKQFVQFVAARSDFKLKVIDLSFEPISERQKRLDELLEGEVKLGFDLQKEPAFRGTLFLLSGTESVLSINMHHIIADGWSFGVILRELGIFYEAILTGSEPTLPDLPIQYGDYANWQQEMAASNEFRSKLDFWKKKLEGSPQILDLPFAKPRPSMPSLKANIISHPLDTRLMNRVHEVSHRFGTTRFQTFLAAFNILLFRLTDKKDILVGSPVANRNLAEIEDLIGCFVNTAIFRTQMTGEMTFADVIKQVREYSLETMAYQDVPVEAIVEHLQPERSLERNPIFQILFIHQKPFIQPIKLPSITFSPIRVNRKGTQLDMTFFLIEREEEISLSCEYREDIFNAESIDSFLNQFTNLLKSIVSNPNAQIAGLSIEEAIGETQLARSEPEPSGPDCLHRMFEAQVELAPNAVALVFEGEKLTNRELNIRANVLASELRSNGVGPDVLVGICIERSVEMVIGILAVLKAGGAYVPLDPAYPDERLKFILDDSQTRIVVATDELKDRVKTLSPALIVIDPNDADKTADPGENLDTANSPDDLAYVIYTSGSTGKPKGVLVTHQNVTRLLSSTKHWFDFGPSDIWTVFHSFAFDFSVWEIWGALAYGGRLVLVPYNTSRSPKEFYELLCKERVTVLNQTPSAFRSLVRAEESLGTSEKLSLRYVIFGGEALDFKSLRPWVKRHGIDSPKLINMYGITETTVHVTYREISEADVENPSGSSIGVPIPDLRFYILDADLRPVPVGGSGEIFVAGPGLARGYLNRPELTAERFIKNPFDDGDHKRLYRTGDLAQLRVDGDIDYLGRIDNQVKIRGFRIEIGEIESTLIDIDGVSEAVVVTHLDANGETSLAAYYVCLPNNDVDAATVRQELKRALPSYMIPNSFLKLDALPLTNNGKVDRKALPSPVSIQTAKSDDIVLPITETEKALVDIWSDVLGVESPGVDENFFELGGHSLQAITMFGAIEERFNKDIPLATLFTSGTIRELAEMLDEGTREHAESSIVPIQPNGSKPPLFCLHAGGGNVLFYRDLAKELGNDQPVYGVQARRKDGRQMPHDTVEEMAEFYLSEIKSIQPEGPYYLCGSSFGGFLGFEIAQQLAEKGEPVGLLGLFDTNGPDYPRLLRETTPLKQRLFTIVRLMQHYRDTFAGLEGPARFAYLIAGTKKIRLKYRRQFREFRKKIVRGFYKQVNSEKDLPSKYQAIEDVIGKANKSYRPEKYSDKVTLFRAVNQPLGIVPDPTLGWDGLANELEIHEVPGHHGSIIAEPYVRTLAAVLRECLAKSQAT